MTARFAPRPEIAPDPVFSFPHPDGWRLPNGLQVHHLPAPGRLLSVMLVTATGVLAEPQGAEGVATLLTRLRRTATAAHDAQELALAFDRLGARSSGEIDDDSATLQCTVPAGNLAAAAALLAETAIAPRLDDDDVERQLRLMRAERTRSLATPGGQAGVTLAEIMFPASDRRHLPALGTSDSLDGLTAADVTAFADRMLRPDDSFLIVAGECSREDVEAAAAPFAAWQPRGAAVRSSSAAVPTTPPRIVLIDRPDSAQAEIRISARATGRANPDWAALEAGASILGGPHTSRLGKALRDERGYTYGVGSDIIARGDIGQLYIGTAVDSAVAAPALQVISDVLSDVHRNGVTDDEVAGAIRELSGAQAIGLQSAAALADALCEPLAAGLEIAWIDELRESLAAVTSAQVSAVLRGPCDVQQIHLVVVGDAAGIRPALAEAFPGVEIEER